MLAPINATRKLPRPSGVALHDLATGDAARTAACTHRVRRALLGSGLGEFGATITFAGNFPGTTQTAPLAVYQALETDPAAAIILSLLLVAVSLVVLVTLRQRLVTRA